MTPPPIVWPPLTLGALLLRTVILVTPFAAVVLVFAFGLRTLGVAWAAGLAVAGLALTVVWIAWAWTAIPRRARAVAARRIARGVPPWIAERRWPADGARTRSVARRAISGAWTAVSAVIPFLWLILRVSPMTFVLTALAVLVTAFGLHAWLKGAVEVRWPEFPLPTGRPVRSSCG